MAEPKARRQGNNDEWPVDENVLQSLSEDVRPADGCYSHRVDDDAVAVNVRSCLAEVVAPMVAAQKLLSRRHVQRQWWRRPSYGPAEDNTLAAARRTQTRLMAVRSSYRDGKYYAPNPTHVSRTVEELSRWTAADPTPSNGHTYTAGTVLYDGDTGACHLHGLMDSRCRVAVDCSRLTYALPRHRSTVKMYSTVRMSHTSGEPDAPVLVPNHFQVFPSDIRFWR